MAEEKLRAERDRQKMFEKRLKSQKNEHFSTLVEELKEQAITKIKNWQSNGKHLQRCETSRAQTINRKQKIYEMQEKLREEKEQKVRDRMQKIEEKKRNAKEKMMRSIENMKKRDIEKVILLKQNQSELSKIIQERNSKIMTDTQVKFSREQLKSASESMPNLKAKKKGRTQSQEIIPVECKVKFVQENAQKLQEEKRRLLEEKMKAFSKRMAEQRKKQEEFIDIKKEQAREWSQTLKLNITKKKRKENYRKRLLTEKIQSIDNKQQLLDQQKKALMAERFYTKINNEMKNYYVKEALEEMALTKQWSIEKLDKIMKMFEPKLEEGIVKDRSKVLKKINKVLQDPFHPMNTRKNRSLSNFLQSGVDDFKEETKSQGY